MKKNFTIILIVLLAGNVFSQTGDDGFNDIVLNTYHNDVEIARRTITFQPGYETPPHTDFHAYIDPDLPLNGGVPVTDGDFNLNYVRTYAPLANNATHTVAVHENLDYTKWHESTTYYDGLGRPIQTVQTKLSPAGSDIIQPIVYDEYGRVKKEYLNYAITQDGNNGPCCRTTRKLSGFVWLILLNN